MSLLNTVTKGVTLRATTRIQLVTLSGKSVEVTMYFEHTWKISPWTKIHEIFMVSGEKSKDVCRLYNMFA